MTVKCPNLVNDLLSEAIQARIARDSHRMARHAVSIMSSRMVDAGIDRFVIVRAISDALGMSIAEAANMLPPDREKREDA